MEQPASANFPGRLPDIFYRVRMLVYGGDELIPVRKLIYNLSFWQTWYERCTVFWTISWIWWSQNVHLIEANHQQTTRSQNVLDKYFEYVMKKIFMCYKKKKKIFLLIFMKNKVKLLSEIPHNWSSTPMKSTN